MDVFLRFVLIVICFIISAIICYSMIKPSVAKARMKKLYYEKENVKVHAAKFEFVPSRKIPLLNLKIHNEEYRVYYVYGYRLNHFNNKKLYRKLIDGEKAFEITVNRGFDKKGIKRYENHSIKW